MNETPGALAPWTTAICRLDDPKAGLFTEAELACRGSGLLELDPRFAHQLARLRMAFGHAMPVSSGCRSRAHNNAIGGHPRSLHIGGPGRYYPQLAGAAAVDVVLADAGRAWQLVRVAQELGWSFGLRQVAAGQMIHLDRRDLAGLARGAFGY
jgi:hypothetical protein